MDYFVFCTLSRCCSRAMYGGDEPGRQTGRHTGRLILPFVAKRQDTGNLLELQPLRWRERERDRQKPTGRQQTIAADNSSRQCHYIRRTNLERNSWAVERTSLALRNHSWHNWLETIHNNAATSAYCQGLLLPHCFWQSGVAMVLAGWWYYIYNIIDWLDCQLGGCCSTGDTQTGTGAQCLQVSGKTGLWPSRHSDIWQYSDGSLKRKPLLCSLLFSIVPTILRYTNI